MKGNPCRGALGDELDNKACTQRGQEGKCRQEKVQPLDAKAFSLAPRGVVMSFSVFILVLLLDSGDLGETTIRVTIT